MATQCPIKDRIMRTHKHRMATVFLFFVVAFVSAVPSPVVKVKHGMFKGAWKESTKGRTYAAFEGVPYARPPVGVNKFRDPLPLKPWTGVRNASTDPLDCLQYDPFLQLVQGQEDCLYLNVYTPEVDADALLPVIVFIHGGSFMYGAGEVYKTDHLLDRDMVVVTINYRLGPLGFLSTGDKVAPGNVGLKDQAAALKWVRGNVRVFGGDPDSVTIMGVSAGAASVHYHFLSPMSRGTFTKGIAISGSAFAPWAHAVKPAEKAKRLATILDCPTTTSQEMMDCLKSLPGEDILEATTKMFDWKLQMFTPFVPTVEAPGGKKPFLTQSPFQATEDGAMFDGPLIVSVTSDEGLYPAAAFQKYPELLDELEERWDELASDLLQFNDSVPADKRESVADKIKEHYFGKKPVGLKTFTKLVQAVSDRLFVADAGRLAQLHAKSGQPVYMYRYSFRGEKSFSNAMTWTLTDYGVAHADDLLHVFKLPFLSSKAADDMRMTRALINMIYSFAINGVPQLAKDGPEWRPVTPGAAKLDYLEISGPKSYEMRTSSDFGQRSFWDSLGFVETENYLHD